MNSGVMGHQIVWDTLRQFQLVPSSVTELKKMHMNRFLFSGILNKRNTFPILLYITTYYKNKGDIEGYMEQSTTFTGVPYRIISVKKLVKG